MRVVSGHIVRAVLVPFACLHLSCWWRYLSEVAGVVSLPLLVLLNVPVFSSGEVEAPVICQGWSTRVFI